MEKYDPPFTVQLIVIVFCTMVLSCAWQTVRIHFRFKTVATLTHTFEGWWLDDIHLEAQPWPAYLPETGQQ